jgi:hypothetical protein
MNVVFFNSQGEVRSGWKAAGFFVALTLIGELGAFLLPRGSRLAGPLGPLVATLVAFAATALCLGLERRPVLSAGLRFDRRWLLEFLLGSAGGVLLLLLVALAVRGADAFHWEPNPSRSASLLLSGAGTFLGVAFNEELIFRGYPFQRLTQGFLGRLGTLVLFGLFFAYAHWQNPGMAGATRFWATLNIALAAILLGLAWIRTGSLALPIGIHLGWNWCQGPLMGFKVSGTEAGGWFKPVLHPGSPDWIHGGVFGLEGTLACAVLCAGACVLVWFWRPGNRGGAAAQD